MDWKLILWDWRFVIALILGVAVYAVADWKNFKIKAYQLMLDAKSLAKDQVLKTGQEQEDWVVEKLYAIMPAKFKLFISEDLLRKIVYKAYHIAKDYLDDGKLNGTAK
jgi:hypothetical protein